MTMQSININHWDSNDITMFEQELLDDLNPKTERPRANSSNKAEYKTSYDYSKRDVKQELHRIDAGLLSNLKKEGKLKPIVESSMRLVKAGKFAQSGPFNQGLNQTINNQGSETSRTVSSNNSSIDVNNHSVRSNLGFMLKGNNEVGSSPFMRNFFDSTSLSSRINFKSTDQSQSIESSAILSAKKTSPSKRLSLFIGGKESEFIIQGTPSSSRNIGSSVFSFNSKDSFQNRDLPMILREPQSAAQLYSSTPNSNSKTPLRARGDSLDGFSKVTTNDSTFNNVSAINSNNVTNPLKIPLSKISIEQVNSAPATTTNNYSPKITSPQKASLFGGSQSSFTFQTDFSSSSQDFKSRLSRLDTKKDSLPSSGYNSPEHSAQELNSPYSPQVTSNHSNNPAANSIFKLAALNQLTTSCALEKNIFNISKIKKENSDSS